MVPLKSVPLGPKVTSLSCAPSKPFRLFASEEHEVQPPVATASSITRLPSAPPRTEQAVSTKYGPGIRYSGREFITAVTTGATATSRGQVLFSVPISPSIIPDTRLQLAASQYTRYIFKRARFYYVGSAPATTAGSVMMYGDYDPTQNPSSTPGDSTLRYAYTHDACEASVWEKSDCTVTDQVYADMLYTDPDEELRFCVQGCLWVISTGAIAANTECGKIILDYEIEFSVPDYRGAIVTPASFADVTMTLTAASIGTTIAPTFSATPAQGVYFLRLNTAPSQTAQYYTSPNAYLQGAAKVTLGAGSGLWLLVDGSGNAKLLWTPDFYSSALSSSVGMVTANTFAGNSTCSVSGIAIASITND